MAATRSGTLWKTPRRSLLVVMSRKKRSIMLSHDALVGVKLYDKAWMPLEPRLHTGVLVGGVVIDNEMQLLFWRCGRINELAELQPFLMSEPLLAGADNGAVGHVERGKQFRGAVALEVMSESGRPSLLERQTRRDPVQRLDLALLVRT